MLNADRCWEAIERRDRSQDGAFFFGVLTTGVYCRPSCPARRPLRSNVRFYGTPAEAERDGLRPCLRCRPLQAYSNLTGDRILELCGYIEAHADEQITLADMAQHAGLSRFHLQRSFKAAVGLTPKQYMETCRMKRFKQNLKEAKGVADAVYDAGFGSASRAYERADTGLGMTPKQYSLGGRGLTVGYGVIGTPAGRLMVAATARGVCFVLFGDSSDQLLRELRKEFPQAVLLPMGKVELPALPRWMAALSNHLDGRQSSVDLPMDVRATVFQARVWRYLQSIPRGETRSYSQVAAALGRPRAARAVARACASNKLAVVIPCHRVIRGDGDLGGYKWGLERKRALLKMESRNSGLPR